MIEVVLGLVLLAASGASAMGAASAVIPMPVGLAVAYALGLLGGVLVGHGVYRVLLRREGANLDWIRSCGLAVAVLALLAVFGLLAPLLAPLLNAFRIAGFPLGFYMVAQGSLIVFAMLAFAAAARAERLDGRRKTKD